MLGSDGERAGVNANLDGGDDGDLGLFWGKVFPALGGWVGSQGPCASL